MNKNRNKKCQISRNIPTMSGKFYNFIVDHEKNPNKFFYETCKMILKFMLK